jgi:multidrug efflux pump
VLTSVVTALGLLPLAFHVDINFFTRTIEYGNPDSQLWVPMATAVVWGLGFSSLLTLVVTPCLLALPARLGRAKAMKPREPSLWVRLFSKVWKRKPVWPPASKPASVPPRAEAAE